MKTFAQLYNDALTQADETSGSGSALAKTIIKTGINEAYSDIASIMNWKELENSTTVSLVPNVNEYTPITNSSTIPRIRRIDSIINQTDNKYLSNVEREQFEKSYPFVDPNVNTGTPTLWYESGYNSNRDIKFKVYLVPDGAKTVQVIYYEEPLELILDGDIPRIPDQWHYGLSYLGLAKYYEYQHDFLSIYYRDQFEAYKAKILMAEYNDTTVMPQMNPQNKNRGFVTGKIGRIYN